MSSAPGRTDSHIKNSDLREGKAERREKIWGNDIDSFENAATRGTFDGAEREEVQINAANQPGKRVLL